MTGIGFVFRHDGREVKFNWDGETHIVKVYGYDPFTAKSPTEARNLLREAFDREKTDASG